MYWDNKSDTIFDSNDASNFSGGYRHFLRFGPLRSSSPIIFDNHSEQLMYSNASIAAAANHVVIEIEKSSERIYKNYNENFGSKTLNDTIGFHHHSSSLNNSSFNDNSSSLNSSSSFFDNSSSSNNSSFSSSSTLNSTDADNKVKPITNANIASKSFTYLMKGETEKSFNFSLNSSNWIDRLVCDESKINLEDYSFNNKSYAKLKKNTESDSRTMQNNDNNNSSIIRQINDDLDKKCYIEFTNGIKNVANIAKKKLYNSKRDSVATIKNELHVLREATVLSRSLCEQNYEKQIETKNLKEPPSYACDNNNNNNVHTNDVNSWLYPIVNAECVANKCFNIVSNFINKRE